MERVIKDIEKASLKIVSFVFLFLVIFPESTYSDILYHNSGLLRSFSRWDAPEDRFSEEKATQDFIEEHFDHLDDGFEWTLFVFSMFLERSRSTPEWFCGRTQSLTESLREETCG